MTGEEKTIPIKKTRIAHVEYSVRFAVTHLQLSELLQPPGVCQTGNQANSTEFRWVYMCWLETFQCKNLSVHYRQHLVLILVILDQSPLFSAQRLQHAVESPDGLKQEKLHWGQSSRSRWSKERGKKSHWSSLSFFEKLNCSFGSSASLSTLLRLPLYCPNTMWPSCSLESEQSCVQKHITAQHRQWKAHCVSALPPVSMGSELRFPESDEPTAEELLTADSLRNGQVVDDRTDRWDSCFGGKSTS